MEQKGTPGWQDLPPVPETADPERYESSSFRDSEFVELRNNEYFDVQMQYPLLGMESATGRCLVRKEVYDRLLLAGKRLKGCSPELEGYKLRIYDAWRPFALQQELYEKYSAGIIRQFGLEAKSQEEREAVIHKFVSAPLPDRLIPPVHTTGGAVDLTILDADGRELRMGTGFDAFTDRTQTAYFEKNFSGEEEIRQNRRLLCFVMTQAGFTNLPSEWWHFDYGDRFWAYYNRCPAWYRGIFTEEEING